MRRRNKPKDDDDNGFGEWGGYMDAKIQKLEHQYAATAAHNNPYKQSDLFAGIAIFVNGLTTPSADELKRIMMQHGGIFHMYYRSASTDFIIADCLPDVKIRALKATSRPVIRADWVVECVRQMRIVNYAPFLLHTASSKEDQPKLCFGAPGAMVTRRSTILDSTQVDQADLAAREEEMVAKMCNEASELPPKPAIDSTIEIDDADVDDADADMFSDDPIDASAPEMSPVVCLVDIGKSALDASFNIADDLNFINRKLLRKQPSSSNLPAPPAATADIRCPEVSVRLLKHPSYDALPLPPKSDSTIAAPNPIASTSSTSAVKTAVDPNFLAEFYSNSRLHHIASLGAHFKNYISQLREQRDLTASGFPARQTIVRADDDVSVVPTASTATIMHIDMDCFFVSVGLRSRPALRGRPVAVTHSKGGGSASTARPGADPERERQLWQQRGGAAQQTTTENRVDTKSATLPLSAGDSLAEIASCSYEARARGLKNGMFVGAALKLCPDLQTIPSCSAGVGGNRLQARMATKRAKPAGQFELEAEAVDEYFAAIELRELPGIGYAMQQRLAQLGWQRCGDLRAVPLGRLQTEFGRKVGETLYQQCRGVDARPLVYGQQRRSVSAEVNYGIRFGRDEEFEVFLRQLAAEVCARLRECRCRGKSVTLKLMVRAAEAPVETAKFLGHGVCDTVSKTHALQRATDEEVEVERAVMGLKRQLTANVAVEDVRGVGIQIAKLEPTTVGADRSEGGRLLSMFAQAKPKTEVVKPPPKAAGAESNAAAVPMRVLRNKRAISLDVPTPTKRAYKKKTKSNQQGKASAPAASSSTAGVDELDLAVLAELPEEMRDEAVRAFRAAHPSKAAKSRAKSKTKTPPKPASKAAVRSPPKPPNVGSNLDADFLSALPDDIRREVLANEQRERVQKQTRTAGDDATAAAVTKESPTKSPGSVTDEVATVAPTEPAPVEESPAPPANQSDGNVLLTADWKETLQQWIDSLDEHDDAALQPVESDVDAVAAACVALIRARRLCDLYLRVRFLFRIVAAKAECRWHRAYLEILGALQVEMRRRYGAKLQAFDRFECGGGEECGIK